jgi:hypothetical protein
VRIVWLNGVFRSNTRKRGVRRAVPFLSDVSDGDDDL